MASQGSVLGAALVGFLVGTAAAPAQAGGAATPAKGKAPVAKCVAVQGALLEKLGTGSWRPLKAGDAVAPGKLLIGAPRADLRSRNGAVELTLLADIGHRGPYPVLESAAVVKGDPKVDLDVTLVRGIIGFKNLKKEGSAKVRLHFRGVTWDLTLEPGSSAGADLYSRHHPGLPTLKGGKVADPITDVMLRVRKGQVFLEADGVGRRLQAPPGIAEVEWDSVERRLEFHRLEKTPLSVLPQDDKERAAFDAVAAACRALTERPLGEALDGLIKSGKKVNRLVGVTWAGALDDLPRLVGALADAKHADVRDHAVLVLRHWMGRGPGQVMKLYQALQDRLQLSEISARMVVQLLFGFTDEDRTHPATYELLIGDLQHPQLAVRELARWHLVRLVPAGRDIPFDPAGPEAARQRGVAQWQALIPEGRLPPQPKAPPASK
jgi:hypothetical protein